MVLAPVMVLAYVGLSARRARRTKSRGPKGLQLEVGAQRAPRLLVSYKHHIILGWLVDILSIYKMRHWCACFQMYQLVHRKGDLTVSELVFFRNKHLKRVGDRI